MILHSVSRLRTLTLGSGLWRSPTLISWANQSITIVGFMVITVVALRVLTTQEFGLWMALNILLGIGLLADMGFRLAASRGLAWYYSGAVDLPDYSADGFRRIPAAGGRPNVPAMARLIRTLQRVYLALILISVPLTSIAGYYLCRNLVQLSGGGVVPWLTVVLAIGVVALNVAGGLYSGLLQGLNQIGLLNGIQFVCGLVRVVASCAMLVGGLRVLALMAVALLVMLLQVVWTRQAFLRPKDPWVDNLRSAPAFDVVIFKRIWPATWRTGVIVVGGYFITQGASMVVTQMPDPALIASYLLTAKVYSVLGGMAIVPLNVMIPQITFFRAKRESDQIRQLMVSRILVILGLLTGLALLASPVGNLILGYFGTSVRLLTGPTAWLLTAWVVLEAHHVFHSTVYSTTNHLPFVSLSIGSGVAIFVLGLLVAPWGCVWLALVQFGVQLVGNNWYPVYLNLKSLDWPLGDYLRSVCLVPFRRKT